MRRVFLCMLLALLVVISGCFKGEDPESEFQVSSSSEILIYVDVLEVSAVTTTGLVVLNDFEPCTIELVDGLNDFLKDIWASVGDTLYRVKLITGDATCSIDYVEYPCTVSGGNINLMIDPFQMEDLTNVFYDFDITLMKRGGRNPFFMLNAVIQVTSYFINTPPMVPDSPSPSDGASEVPTQPTLSWNCEDTDGGELSYDVYLSEPSDSSSLVEIASALNTNYFELQSDLPNASTYYWKVVATDSLGARTEGPIWSFNTQDIVVPEGSFLLKFSLAQQEAANFQLQDDRELSLIYTDIEEEGTSGRFVLADGANSIQLSKGGTYVLGIAERYNGVINVLGLIGDAELGLHTLPVSYAANDIIDLGNLILNGEVYTSELITGQDLCNILGHSYETLAAFGKFDMTLKKFLNPDINKNGLYDEDEDPVVDWTFATQTGSKWFEKGDIVFDDIDDPIKIPIEEFNEFEIKFIIGIRNCSCLPVTIEPSAPARLTLPNNLGQVELPGGQWDFGFHYEPYHWETGWGTVWFGIPKVNDLIPPYNGDYVLEINDSDECVYYFDDFDFLTPDDYLEGFIFALSKATAYPNGRFKSISWRWYRMIGDGTYVLATPDQVRMAIWQYSFFMHGESPDDFVPVGFQGELIPEDFGYDSALGGTIPLTEFDCWLYKNLRSSPYRYVTYDGTQYDKGNNTYAYLFRADIIGEPTDPSPAEGSTEVSLQPTLSWETFTDGETLEFTVQISLSIEDFDNYIFFETTTDSTSITIPPEEELTYSPIYYWRVFPSMEDPLHPGETVTYDFECPIWSFSTVYPGNYPPSVPMNPEPSDDATDIMLVVPLSWISSDPDGDPVLYDLYFGTADASDSLPLLVQDCENSTILLSDFVSLEPNTTYCWKIVAKDSKGGVAEGPLWSFTTFVADEEVVFEDASLAQAVRDYLGKDPEEPIYPNEVAQIDGLFADSRNISNISGIEQLSNLRFLYINENNITDISPVASLTNLRYLNIEANNISDISPLSNLNSLTGLSMGNNPINNLSPLYDMTNLESLALIKLSLTDEKILSLSNLTQLTELWISQNSITNLSPIQSLVSLGFIDFGMNFVSDLSPIQGLTKLTYLFAYDNKIADISSLPNMSQLSYLGIWNNRISDLSPLTNLTSLIYLNCSDNLITDISPLSNLTNLQELHISGNIISSIGELSQASILLKQEMSSFYQPASYDLQSGPVEEKQGGIFDIQALEGLVNLRSLNLSSNIIADITPLESLVNLEWLSLYDNEIEDISPLVNNLGIGSGDFVDVNRNYLDLTENSTDMVAIVELQSRGVNINYQDQKTTTSGSYIKFNPQTGEKIRNVALVLYGNDTVVSGDSSYGLFNLDDCALGEWNYGAEVETITSSGRKIYLIQGSLTIPGAYSVDLSAVTDCIDLTLQDEAGLELSPTADIVARFFLSDLLEFQSELYYSEMKRIYGNLGTIEQIHFAEKAASRHWMVEDAPLPSIQVLSLEDHATLNFSSDIDSYEWLGVGIAYDHKNKITIDYESTDISIKLMPFQSITYEYAAANNGRTYLSLKENQQLSAVQVVELQVLGGLRFEFLDITDEATAIEVTQGNLRISGRLKDNSEGSIEVFDSIPFTGTLRNENNEIIWEQVIWRNNDFDYDIYLPTPGSYSFAVSAQLLDFPSTEYENEYLVRELILNIPQPIEISFADPNLEAVIREIIGKPEGPIYKHEVMNIEILIAYDRNISLLEGIGHLESLRHLSLNNNEITDVTPLLTLTELEVLDLGNNQISNVSELVYLESVRLLRIPTMGLYDSDILFLQSLPNLEFVDLQNNQLTTVALFLQMPNLKGIWIGNNPIPVVDLQSLASMTWLEELALGEFDLQGDNFDFVASLTNLISLCAEDCNIESIDSLTNLIYLRSLNLANNKIEDISPLINNTGFRDGAVLDISYNSLELTSGSADMLNIQALIDRAVDVQYYPQNSVLEEIFFPDPNLDQVVREYIGKNAGEPIYANEVLWIEDFHAEWRNISNISGIEHLSNLRYVYINENNITDISPLASLAKLEYLNIETNNISDISSLSAINSLTGLSMGNNPIANFSPIETLSNLQTLALVDLSLTDENIGFLSSLPQLAELWIPRNSITDLSPLQGLVNLSSLFAFDNNISSISPLSNMSQLSYLGIWNNRINDLSPISNLTSLIYLNCSDNLITDISPLSNLTNLQELHISGNIISSIGELSQASILLKQEMSSFYQPASYDLQLGSVEEKQGGIFDIQALEGLVNLRSLNLSSNIIADITPLESLVNLEWLSLYDNEIEDISPLVNNLGIGSGDFVDVNRNYLDLTENSTDMVAIVELQSRGVNVNYQEQKTPTSDSYIKFNPQTGEKIRSLNIVFFRENQSTSTGTDKGILDISDLEIGIWGYMARLETLSLEGVKQYLLEGTVSVPGATIVELSSFTDHADITLIDENGMEISDSSIVTARFFLLDFYETQSTTSYSEVKMLYGNIPTIAMIHFIELGQGRHWFAESLPMLSSCSLSLENCATLNFIGSIDLYEAIDLGISFNFRSKVSTQYHTSDFTIRLMPCDTVGYHYGVCRNGTCYFSNLEGLQLTSGQTLDMHVLEGLHIEIDGIPDDTTAVTMNTGIQWLGARLKDASGCLECQIPVTITLYDEYGSVIHQEEIWNWDFGHELDLPSAGNYELVISAHLLDFPDSELQNTYLVRTLQINVE